tara:strand:+ start:146 stop:568 length:423 start_codon:yes stop_codon:yes gene_type:complete
MSDTDNTVNTSTTYLGRVKWFNNRAGFGFATVMEGDKKDEDIFTHHTGISVDSEQYKYLVQGEYITFSLRESDNDKHPYQAGNIKGVAGGPLMCETKNDQRQQQSEYESENSHTNTKQSSHSRWRGRGNRWRSSKKDDMQ